MMAGMSIYAIDHVQLAMPAGAEAEAIAFYAGVLGLPEVPKPAPMAARGGCWFEVENVKIHLGVDPNFTPARKAHPALVVSNLQVLAATIADAGFGVAFDDELEGFDRAFVNDPFGNRIELMQPHDS